VLTCNGWCYAYVGGYDDGGGGEVCMYTASDVAVDSVIGVVVGGGCG